MRKAILILGLLFCILNTIAFAQDKSNTNHTDSLNNELFLAIRSNNLFKIRNLVKSGANVNAYSEDGITPLLYAIDMNNMDMVQLLLENDANPNIKSKTNKQDYPLLLATELGYLKIVELLLQYNVNVDNCNANGLTALHFASFFNDSLLIEKLVARSNATEPLTRKGETPLIYAAFNGSEYALKILLDAGASPGIPDQEGFTPLIIASQNGHYNFVYTLLSAGAEINARDHHGFSALSYAILNNYNEIADLLLLNGADKNEINSLSLNPLALAKISGNKPIEDSLRRAGAQRNYLPCFKYAGSIGVDLRLNNKDFLTGITISSFDIKYKLEYSLFYYLRPFAVAILEKDKSIFYQYWERRHIVGMSLTKRINIWDSGNNSLSLYGGGAYEFHFGRYRGTLINNESGFFLSPQMGIICKRNRIDFRLSGQYIKFETTGLTDWYVNFAVRWNFKRKIAVNKVITYINYK
jgi:ankyrin repeat protein